MNSNSIFTPDKKRFDYYIQLSVIIACIYLIYIISKAVITNQNFIESPSLIKQQLWICIYFIIIFFIELIIADNRWNFIKHNIIFLLISIPYTSIIPIFKDDLGIETLNNLSYTRYIPILRGGYAIAIVVKWISSNKATTMLLTYILTLSSLIYFGSLVFYEVEHITNPQVKNYWDAAYWAMMNSTTVGSYIIANSIIGQILSVILSMFGMMLLPVFTIYVTNLIKGWR